MIISNNSFLQKKKTILYYIIESLTVLEVVCFIIFYLLQNTKINYKTHTLFFGPNNKEK